MHVSIACLRGLPVDTPPDLQSVPGWGRNMETAGEDPTVVSEFGKAFVEGIAGNGSTLIAAAAPKQCAERSSASY